MVNRLRNSKPIIGVIVVIVIVLLLIGGSFMLSNHHRATTEHKRHVSTQLISHKKGSGTTLGDKSNSTSSPEPSNKNKAKIPRAIQGAYLSVIVPYSNVGLEYDSALYIGNRQLNIRSGARYVKGLVHHENPKDRALAEKKILPRDQRSLQRARASFNIKGCRQVSNDMYALYGDFDKNTGQTAMRNTNPNPHKIIIQTHGDLVRINPNMHDKPGKSYLIGRGTSIENHKIFVLTYKKMPFKNVLAHMANDDHVRG